MGAQLSWESICLTSRGSQVRALLFPPKGGPVVQLVRTLACHARGRRFEPVPGRHFFILPLQLSWQSRGLKILVSLVRFRPEAPWMSLKLIHFICGCSSSGRAPPCQGGGSEFEPRHPLQKILVLRNEDFFIHCESNGISSRATLSPLYLITAGA